MMRVAAFLVVGLALTGCSSSKSPMQVASRLPTFQATADVHVRWHSEVGASVSGMLVPALAQDSVYATNSSGDLYRFDRKTGKKIWRIDLPFHASAGVGAGEGVVVVGSDKGEIATYSEDGKLRWQARASSELLAPPVVSQGAVLVRSADSRIASFDIATGARTWLYERAIPALVVRSNAGVVARLGVAYAGFAAGKVAAINLSNGAIRWEAAVSQPHGNTELERISDITSQPEIDNDVLCAGSFQGRVGCFDIAQGGLLWSRELSIDKGLSLLYKNLYVVDFEGNLLAMEKRSGSSLWKNSQLKGRCTSAPFATDRYVAVGDFEGYLHLLNREDGSMAASFKADSSAIRATPLDMDGGLLLLTQDGGLYSVEFTQR